ncbi:MULTISPECIES: DUF2325 domain-containing protein [unclassified Variovorax]|uniref:DUF2325 domain-containing protein n=1 Tax=unclassified Variovorax TaxID=663243 RepID=UPI000F7DD9E1|nr:MULTISPECIES: DUF2325 domain-containing protein [unclassified Variovorax]RSZ41199.1 DUF2325 domain-containing protein [Variovorax sp. 553]RSZ41893.1 DUF2325 domain-containing protein [Variovorax sp. 679]
MQEHAVLLRAYARVQERCSRLLVEQAALVERLEAQIVRLRGALVARDSAIAIVREELAARASAGGALPKRLSALLSPGSRRHLAIPPQSQATADLREKAVLCVGHEEEAPSLARQLVEIAGGRYLHHDGGDDADDPALEASLRAADLVICQTGCVSHDAYWRVQDHCRRTGKPCVLVGEPQPMLFVRHPAAAAENA